MIGINPRTGSFYNPYTANFDVTSEDFALAHEGEWTEEDEEREWAEQMRVEWECRLSEEADDEC